MAHITKAKNLERILRVGAESRVMRRELKISYSIGATTLALAGCAFYLGVSLLPQVLAIEGGTLLGLSFLNQYEVGKHRSKAQPEDGSAGFQGKAKKY